MYLSLVLFGQPRLKTNGRRSASYGHRLPPVVAPAPTQPVFKSQACALYSLILSDSILAYRMGCKAKNGWAKQDEKVA